ncbi:MAG: VanW family protein [Chloroflexi bacterium]|nr:VanW family protein [Chloroflexota bacterium]
MASISASYSSQESPLNSLSRWLAMLAALAVIAVSILGLGLGGVEIAYGNTLYPGVSVRGIDLSGLSQAEASDLLSRAFTYPQTPSFTFRDGDKAWTATPAELGATFAVEETVNRAFAYGRSGNLRLDLEDQFWAWYEGTDIAPVMMFDPNRATAYLSSIASQIDTPPVEAALTVNGTQVVVTPGAYGRTVNVGGTLDQIITPLRALGSADVPLVIVEYRPGVLDASQQAAIAQTILSQPMTLVVENPRPGDPGPWTFDQNELASMLTINRTEDANGARYEVGLEATKLTPFLETLTPLLEVKPQDARFIFNDEKHELEIIPGKEAVDGRLLNVAATIQNINAQAVTGGHTIPLVFDIVAPQIGKDTKAADLGITGLVSDQVTYFAGSSAERINNIRTGSAAFHGVLVPPGGTFSFNEVLGDISLDTGFSEALIIYAGRTIKGVGGGICQVSTTAFRAALFGGYPIVERHSHAYRVGYYEKGFGPGLDATIFSPVADFKFINDRQAWLLIETYVYNNGVLQFKFYSADDGRKVTVGTPDVKNVVPAPNDKYEENAELATGTIKQVDFKADGADTVVIRKVERDGQVLWEDAIRTHYLPWQAVYQYGPGTTLPEGANAEATATPTPTP